MKTLKLLFVSLLILVVLASPALSEGNETTNATATPTAAATTVAPTATATPAATTAASTPTVVVTTAPATPVPTEGKFREGPTVRLRPVTDVIEAEQDGIVELYMRNPSLNDVTLHVDAEVSVPSGIHVYGSGFGTGAAAGTVAGTFDVPPGAVRSINVVIKADKSARLGSHTLQFTGTYYPGDNKDNYQVVTLTYPVTVKEASKEPEKPPAGTETPKETPKVQIPGFGVVLAIFGVFAIARLLSRKT